MITWGDGGVSHGKKIGLLNTKIIGDMDDLK